MITPNNCEPKNLYYVLYKNINNEWTLSMHSYYLENARKHATLLDRPCKILTYSLHATKKVKRVRRVRRPKNE